MIISDEKKFIFIHINMTGGTTIDQALLPYYDHWPILARRLSYTDRVNPYQGKVNNIYLDCCTYQNLLTISQEYKRLIEEYFVFTFVRNPYDKHYSFYQKEITSGRLKNTDFSAFQRFRPNQVSHLPPLDLVNFIGKTEHFESSIASLLTKIDLPKDIEFTPKNVSSKLVNGYRYLEKYDQATIAAVNKQYSDDFEAFGFELLDPEDFPESV